MRPVFPVAMIPRGVRRRFFPGSGGTPLL